MRQDSHLQETEQLIEPLRTWNVIVKVYIRVTTLDGSMFEGKEISRRRKSVSKNWWNKEWLARLLGVVQALQTSDGLIEIGEGTHTITMQTYPLTWNCPVGLDVQALAAMSDIGEEIAQYRTRDDEDEEEETTLVSDGTVGS